MQEKSLYISIFSFHEKLKYTQLLSTNCFITSGPDHTWLTSWPPLHYAANHDQTNLGGRV